MRVDSRRRALLRGFAVAGALVSTFLVAPAARGATDRPHDPIGRVSAVNAVPGGVEFVGWAADPDELSANATVAVLIDGRTWAGSQPTSIEKPTVTAAYGTGDTPGFDITATLDGLSHIVCLVVRNVDAGLDAVLKCVPTPLGTTLTSSQLAARSPIGAIEHAWAGTTGMRVTGWSSDPDYVSRRAIVVLYVDGQPAATVTTHLYPAPRPDGAGARSAFDITVPVSSGMHIGCIWVVNVGLGSNAFLGCKVRDTRGRAGTGTVTTPTLNQKVVAVAKRQVGDPYVWGATGPDAFDCSGLVMFSYGRGGFTTPRISEDQAKAARLIPASRAVPGDLVFYHDRVGDVYHVGIYLGPGSTIAAIDPAHGVAYQKIWDPTVATYGSFTHT
jgi:hypothetical protein